MEDVKSTIEEKLKACQTEFTKIEQLMESLVQQSKDLQKQYDEAVMKREQIRGEYTGYVNLLATLSQNKEENKNSNDSVKDNVKAEKPKAKKETTLSDEEKAKIKAQVKASTMKSKGAIKEDEDYLNYLNK